MKVAPLYHALRREGWCETALVYTGQHYDDNMSGALWHNFDLPRADYHLGVGSGTHAEQTAAAMISYERVCIERRPDWVVVVGDVNSTLACAIAAKKLCISVAHLEAGLRSRDRTMPEEINRIVTDAIADLLWTPSEDADENLRNEGIDACKIVRVGNMMMDSYELLRSKIESDESSARYGLENGKYGVVTIHRPINVDTKPALVSIVEELIAVSKQVKLVFPVHPRTRRRLEEYGLMSRLQSVEGIILADPLAYISFMSLVREAAIVISDSGGVQEETTYLGIPCLTLRENTERPITVTQGTNRLVRVETLMESVRDVMSGNVKRSSCPALWDGRTAERVVGCLRELAGA
jgi:UDP-N-acetylglucosamine 2-epimerase (non-hydrolysing)